MTIELKQWTPKTETVVDAEGHWRVRPDYWSQPYPTTPAMLAAIKAGLERPFSTERKLMP